MTRLTLDADTLVILPTLTDPVEILDASGKTLGYYHPLHHQKPLQSPVSREELEKRRQLRTGKPLADILKDLGAS